MATKTRSSTQPSFCWAHLQDLCPCSLSSSLLKAYAWTTDTTSTSLIDSVNGLPNDLARVGGLDLLRTVSLPLLPH